jgi:hypothetical protein
LGSLAELETQLIIAKEIEYLTQNGLEALLSQLDRIKKNDQELIKRNIIMLTSGKTIACFFLSENRKPKTENQKRSTEC